MFAATHDCVSILKWKYNVINANRQTNSRAHTHTHTLSYYTGMQNAARARCTHTRIIHTPMSPPPQTHTHIHDSSAKPHIHTGALARHKPHSYTHAHSCSAYLPAIGRDPDTACQCTSLPEPQAAGGEEETDGYQLFG